MEIKNELCYGAKMGAALLLMKDATNNEKLKKSILNLWEYNGMEEIVTIQKNIHYSDDMIWAIAKANKMVSWLDNIDYETLLTDRDKYKMNKTIARFEKTRNKENLVTRLEKIFFYNNKHKKAIASFNSLKEEYLKKAQELQNIFDTYGVNGIVCCNDDDWDGGYVIERNDVEYAPRIKNSINFGKHWSRHALEDYKYAIYEDDGSVETLNI